MQLTSAQSSLIVVAIYVGFCLLELIRTIARHGTTVVLVTHKLDEALAVADRVTALQRGRVTQRPFGIYCNSAVLPAAMSSTVTASMFTKCLLRSCRRPITTLKQRSLPTIYLPLKKHNI